MFQGENRSQVCFKGMSFFQLADVQMQIRPLLQICQPELVQLHVDMFIIGKWALYRIHLSALIDPSVELTLIDMWSVADMARFGIGNTWIPVISTRQQNWHSKHVTFYSFCFHPHRVSPDRCPNPYSHVSPFLSSWRCRGVHHSVLNFPLRWFIPSCKPLSGRWKGSLSASVGRGHVRGVHGLGTHDMLEEWHLIAKQMCIFSLYIYWYM